MMVLIDGYNLLRSIQKTDEDFESISDLRLCHIVGRYLKLIGEKGEIIFDGTGPRNKGRFDNVDGLEVFFAGIGTDADSMIEDKIKADTAPRRLTVVSSDRRLRKATQRRRAVSVKSDAFWHRVMVRLSKGKKRRDPVAKRAGLSESETKQWLEFFGVEQ